MPDPPPNDLDLIPTGPLEPEHNYDAWIGRHVYVDGDPDAVGTITELFYDVGTQRPEWLILDPGHRIVPLAVGPELGGLYNDLYVAHTADKIADAPQLPASGQLSVDEEQALYTYWGFDWDNPVPVELPARFDDGWDTNWETPQVAARDAGSSSRMVPFIPTITEPPPPPV